MNASKLLVALAIKNKGDWDKIYQDIRDKNSDNLEQYLEGFNTPCITIFDEEYPDYLKQIMKPPFVLFYHGDINLIKNIDNNIAVAGIRNPSEEGKSAMEYIGGHLGSKNIVSGLCKGSETIALKKAISNGNKPIVVLGSGINCCYPVENQKLYDKVKETGLILSEYPDLVPPEAYTMPFRKRIISALSKTIVCGEIKKHDGVNILISMGLDEGKSVYIAPMSMSSNSYNNQLIYDGAFPIVNENYLADRA